MPQRALVRNPYRGKTAYRDLATRIQWESSSQGSRREDAERIRQSLRGQGGLMKRESQILIETGSSGRRACTSSMPTSQLSVSWDMIFRTFLSMKSFVS